MEVVDIAISYRSRGVVGVDLCGDPSKGDVSVFGPAFAKAKAHGLKLTLHYAEIPASSIEVELRTLLSYAPDRIGHVIHVPEDVKAIIEERELGLELCLSCNVHAKLTTGTFVSIFNDKTDDVGIFNSALSNEYLLAATHFHLSRQGIIELSKAGIDAIFGGEEEKKRLRLLVQDFEDGVHSR
ncbi:MAG: hypothetical protein M1827_001563 [Pycnora praestabilis]|nr:MAG: hypothetical protein M1827_001563 [Pycnora praestabilis]